jgi:molybdopterin-binding protein
MTATLNRGRLQATGVLSRGFSYKLQTESRTGNVGTGKASVSLRRLHPLGESVARDSGRPVQDAVHDRGGSGGIAGFIDAVANHEADGPSVPSRRAAPLATHARPDCPLNYLTVAETAKLLHLNVKRVQALARAGTLPATRVGRKWLLPREKVEAMLGAPSEPSARGAVELSARNQLRGRIVGLTTDGLMCEVRLEIGDQELVSVITRSSSERLRLKPGDTVLAVIKSTEVMIGRD